MRWNLAVWLIAFAAWVCPEAVCEFGKCWEEERAEPGDAPALDSFGNLERLELRPGDRFVLTVPGRISDDEARRIGATWAAFVGGDAEDLKLLVLDGGRRLSVLSATPRPGQPAKPCPECGLVVGEGHAFGCPEATA